MKAHTCQLDGEEKNMICGIFAAAVCPLTIVKRLGVILERAMANELAALSALKKEPALAALKVGMSRACDVSSQAIHQLDTDEYLKIVLSPEVHAAALTEGRTLKPHLDKRNSGI